MFTILHPHNHNYRVVRVDVGDGSPVLYLLQHLDTNLDWQYVYSPDTGCLVVYYHTLSFTSIVTFEDVEHASRTN